MPTRHRKHKGATRIQNNALILHANTSKRPSRCPNNADDDPIIPADAKWLGNIGGIRLITGSAPRQNTAQPLKAYTTKQMAVKANCIFSSWWGSFSRHKLLSSLFLCGASYNIKLFEMIISC